MFSLFRMLCVHGEIRKINFSFSFSLMYFVKSFIFYGSLADFALYIIQYLRVLKNSKINVFWRNGDKIKSFVCDKDSFYALFCLFIRKIKCILVIHTKWFHFYCISFHNHDRSISTEHKSFQFNKIY